MSNRKSDEGRNEINLRNLKRMDDSIKEILATASAVGAYQFVFERKNWDKLEIEGPLHIVRRSSHPRTAMIIMNRLNTDNLVQPITKDTEVKIELPFLMVKNLEKGIFCIWFYSEQECQETGTLLTNELNNLTRNRTSLGREALPPSSPATSTLVPSLVDTLAQIGIKNITVAKSASKGSETNNLHNEVKTVDYNELIQTPSNNMHKISENGGRSVNLQDLFAKATLAQGGNASIPQAPHTDPRPVPRATPRNIFAPVNLLHDLERAKVSEENRGVLLGRETATTLNNDSYEDEMLTPAMIKERSKLKSHGNDDRQIGMSISPIDLVPSSGDSYIFGPPTSMSNINIADQAALHRITPNNQPNLSQTNFIDLQLPNEQLKAALIHLIQTDFDFVAKIKTALITLQQQQQKHQQHSHHSS